MTDQAVETAVKAERVWLWHRKLSGVKCDIVTEAEFGEALYDVVDKMFATMKLHSGIGLSAPQIGVFKRISVLHMLDEPGNPKLVMVNPVIIDSNGEFRMMEGCLSLPCSTRSGTRARTTRAASVYFSFQDINGKSQSMQADGVMSVAVQHEIDHLDGKFFFDTLKPVQRKLVLDRFAKSVRSANQIKLAEGFVLNAERSDRPLSP